MRVARGFDVLRAVAERPRSGSPSPRSSLRAAALEMIRADRLVEASYVYDFVKLDTASPEFLHVGGAMLHAPRLLPESGTLTGLAFAVCTLGPGLEARVSELFAQRRASLALMLDTIGNELLMAASRRVQDRMLADARRRGLTMAGELRAGDPGLALDAQDTVLRLAQAELVGVCLREGHVMVPLKSISMVLGIGIDLPPAQWSRCDECPQRDKCVALRGESEAVQ